MPAGNEAHLPQLRPEAAKKKKKERKKERKKASKSKPHLLHILPAGLLIVLKAGRNLPHWSPALCAGRRL